MKNLGLTFLMMLFIGVGTSMAQDKKAAEKDAAAPAKTEMSAEKAHKCSADCTKACCAKKADGTTSKAAADKKACAPGCEKRCCTADAGKAKHEEHDHQKHAQPH